MPADFEYPYQDDSAGRGPEEYINPETMRRHFDPIIAGIEHRRRGPNLDPAAAAKAVRYNGSINPDAPDPTDVARIERTNVAIHEATERFAEDWLNDNFAAASRIRYVRWLRS